MPRFDTPTPIVVAAELASGDLRIVATERTDTSVEVRPSNPGRAADVSAAANTRVEYTSGTLIIKSPKGRLANNWLGGVGTVAVEVMLPFGSSLRGITGAGALRCSGRLGASMYKSGAGDMQLDEAGELRLVTGAGDITINRVVGRLDVTSGAGSVRVGSIDGPAEIKNSSGDMWIGEISGDLRAVMANGTIVIDKAESTVVAKTANGDIRVGEVARRAIVAQTSFGNLEVGIREGVAAWLDLDTRYGTVHNHLQATGHPAPGVAGVEVRARTSYGDITIRRAVATAVMSGR